METLGVSIIQRDEPIDRVAMLVDHLQPITTQYSIVDTGSVDFEVDAPLIRGWGKVQLNQFEWIDDFAAARNETLKYLTTDWVLQMDCDEMVSHAMYDSIVRVLENCEPQTLGWLYFTRNIWGGEIGVEVDAHWHTRLFRRSAGRYYKALHEQVSLNGKEEGNTRGTMILPYAAKDSYLLHSKPREKIEVSAALYKSMEGG